jgi:hypothetical protein
VKALRSCWNHLRAISVPSSVLMTARSCLLDSAPTPIPALPFCLALALELLDVVADGIAVVLTPFRAETRVLLQIVADAVCDLPLLVGTDPGVFASV